MSEQATAAEQDSGGTRSKTTGRKEESGGGETTTTVIIAFFANLAIAIGKTVVALMSGSASMLAEAAHSWADTGNQILLFIADKRSRRDPDPAHPLGYGREAYVWSLMAAFGLFTAGAVVSIWHGISTLGASSEEEASYTWAYVVLAIAFVFEGASFTQAYRQTRKEAKNLDRDVLDHALRTSDPTLRAVFAEDSAALVGLVIAGLGVFLHQLTGNAVYDAIGSILVGILLGVVAVVLINQNRRFITGQESDPELRRLTIARLKELPGVQRVAYLRMEFVGPRKTLLIASVDLDGEQLESQVAYRLRELEAELETESFVREAVLTLATPDEPGL
ncbi:cation diffusion facilitator family transporter [Nocardioides mesophilus]|uniref:Cation diffusion facilitator family transporter n=1 Tax=Nocardioides mesophilus TaxID=433659 RepID=A0A7G9RET9_9ACTN|nr:cation diffusion facilitator family transporter [Nocardioides mesophilus]QNN54114.1 cation diffusion facilitator family transporter [Nocardioides mesophilus]